MMNLNFLLLITFCCIFVFVQTEGRKCDKIVLVSSYRSPILVPKKSTVTRTKLPRGWGPKWHLANRDIGCGVRPWVRPRRHRSACNVQAQNERRARYSSARHCLKNRCKFKVKLKHRIIPRPPLYPPSKKQPILIAEKPKFQYSVESPNNNAVDLTPALASSTLS